VTAAVVVPAALRARSALGRLAAVLAVASASVHLLLVEAASLGSLAMLGLALLCLPCAWHLWRSPSGRTWGVAAAMDVAMLAVHVQALDGSGHAGHGGSASALVWLGLGLVTSQLVLAGCAALRR
jgi:hypothetical protein